MVTLLSAGAADTEIKGHAIIAATTSIFAVLFIKVSY
jgi:hypothetical protein